MATATDLQALEKAVWKDLGIEKDGVKEVYQDEAEDGRDLQFESFLEATGSSIQAIAALMKTDRDEVWDSGVDSDKASPPPVVTFTDMESVPILPSLSDFEPVEYPEQEDTDGISIMALDTTGCSGGSLLQRHDKIEEVRVTVDSVEGTIKPKEVKVIAKKSTPRKGGKRGTGGALRLVTDRSRTATESTDEFPLVTQSFDQLQPREIQYEFQWDGHTSPFTDCDEVSSEYGDSASGRRSWEDQFDNNRPQKKRRYEEEPSSDPSVEKSRKNAIIAKRNRDKKKQRMEELELKVKMLESENVTLKRENKQLNSTVGCLTDEIEYLKTVIANETALGPILQQVQGCFPVRFTGSFETSKKLAKGGKAVQSKTSGGVCIHVDGSNVSLEMCRVCSKMSNGASHTTVT